MKLITLFLVVGMFAVSGWTEQKTTYSLELEKRAEAGDAEGQANLGLCYYKGEGVTHDIKEAVKWLMKAAEQGNAEGQYGLGNCYDFGEGIKQDKGKAVELFTKSAEQGNADAQYALRNCYCLKADEYIRTPDNLPRIEEARKMAKEWCLKAAEGGNRHAQRTLGHDYFYNTHSKGAERIKELEESKKWYLKAQEQGDSDVEKMVRLCELKIQKEQRQLKTK